MQHMLVYNKNQSANVTDSALTFASDPAVPTDASGNPILPSQWKLLAGAAFGTNLQAARLNSPYFRRTFLPYMWPLNGNDTIGNDPNIWDLRDHPMTLPALEGIEADTTNGTGTNRHTMALMIADGAPQQLTGGEVYSVRCTGAITSSAYAFVSGAITFGQTLPQGQYALTGALVFSATGILARFILPGQAYRPGVIAMTSLTNRPPFVGRKAPLGVMGTFYSTSLPQFEIYCQTSNDTTQTIFLDLVKIG